MSTLRRIVYVPRENRVVTVDSVNVPDRKALSVAEPRSYIPTGGIENRTIYVSNENRLVSIK